MLFGLFNIKLNVESVVLFALKYSTPFNTSILNEKTIKIFSAVKRFSFKRNLFRNEKKVLNRYSNEIFSQKISTSIYWNYWKK